MSRPLRAPSTRLLTRQRLHLARFRVTVMTGPNRGLTCVSSGMELTVGCDGSNDLLLSDPSVSGHHCVFVASPTGVEVRDLGSTNGTFVNGIRVNSAFVPSPATLSIGQSTMRFEGIDEPISEPLSREDAFGPVLGHSAAMRRLFAILERVAPTDATVLLEGETGTGKGLAAEAIHATSHRSGGPFVVVDCASMPAGLMESELFGHVRGAFTGADQDRVGLFEQAAGGTVFLDEIAELPLDLQPKLLRVLERRTIRRVGSASQLPVDVRIIAATNRDLRREVNQGTVRSDLRYRLDTVRLVLPPLRERREDIPLLVSHFYRHITGDDDACPPIEMVEALARRTWPGNVRELANAVEQALVFGNNAGPPPDDRETDHLPGGGFDPKQTFRDAKQHATSRWERRYLIQLIGYHDGNISAAARTVKMDRTHLRTLLHRYQVPIPGRDDGE